AGVVLRSRLRGVAGAATIPRRMLDSVLVVEEHDGVRSALRDRLLTSFPPLRLREARSMEEALRLADQAQLDLILVNLELPGPNGIEATRALPLGDRKSTRLNSSHVAISYAVFCLKKKINIHKVS